MAMSARTQDRLREKYGIGPPEPDTRTDAEKIALLERQVEELQRMIRSLWKSHLKAYEPPQLITK